MILLPRKRCYLARRRAASALIALSLAMVAVACGSDDDGATTGSTGTASASTIASTTPSSGTDAPGTSAAPAESTTPVAPVDEDVDPEGILKVEGILDSSGGAQFYPTTSKFHLDDSWMISIYGTLLKVEPDGTIVPWLAESYEVVDGSTIDVTLRSGMTFSNGEKFDAEAVASGLLSSFNEPFDDSVHASRSPAFKQLLDVAVIDPLNIEITLSTPVAGQFLLALVNPREGAISAPASRDTDATYPTVAPIGAGPFVFEEFVPNQYILLKKNPTFFDTDNWKLGGIQFVQTLPGPTQTTALLSNAIDIGRVPSADVAGVEGNSTYNIESVVSETDYTYLNMCTTQAPFDDPRVRMALSLAIDREQLSELAQAGLAEPQLGYWPSSSPQHNPDLADIVKFDRAAAESLLTEAGVTDLTIDLYAANGDPAIGAAEIIQAQLAEIGVDMTITPQVDVIAGFVEPQKSGMLTSRASRLVEPQIGATQTGGILTLCGVEHPDIAEKMAAAAVFNRNDPEAIKLYQEVDQIVAENTWLIFLTTLPQNWVWNSDVVGGTALFSPLNGKLDFSQLYVKN